MNIPVRKDEGGKGPFALARLTEGGTGYRDVTFQPAVHATFEADRVLLRRDFAERLLAPVPASAGGTAPLPAGGPSAQPERVSDRGPSAMPPRRQGKRGSLRRWTWIRCG